MRFFTMSWWCGVQTGAGGDPAIDYAAHLANIRGLLPPDLLATEESVSLHDARLRELRILPAESSLHMVLSNYAGDERFILLYGRVESFESTADSEVGLGGPFGYGDLGYCEVEVLASGAFEHRLLFSSGIELAVTFREFQLLRTSAA